MQYHRAILRAASVAALALCLLTPARALDILVGEDIIQQIEDNVVSGGELVVLEGPEDENDRAVYGLSETLVVTEDISPLTIEGSRTTSGDTAEFILPNQIVLQGAAGPVIEVEEGATLILKGVAITDGSIGVSALANSSVAIERCYIYGTGAEGLQFTDVANASVKSSAIVGCGGDGVQADGGSVTIFQCTILDNGGAGVNAISGGPSVFASIVYNNVLGLTGSSMDAQNNWVFKNRCSGGAESKGSFPLESDQIVATPRAATGAGCGEYTLSDDALTIDIQHNLTSPVEARLMEGAEGEDGVPLFTFASAVSPISETFTLDSAAQAALEDGELYVVITSASWVDGHIRGQIKEGLTCVSQELDFALDPDQVGAATASTSLGCGHMLRLHNEMTLTIDHDVMDPVEVTVGTAPAGLPEASTPEYTFANPTVYPLTDTFELTADADEDLNNGNLYVLISGAAGDIRGQIEAGDACEAIIWDFPLDADQVAGGSDSTATGCGHFFLNQTDGTNRATLTLTHDVTDPQSVAVYEGTMGATGTEVFPFPDAQATQLREQFTLTDDQASEGALYALVTSAARPTGDIRGQIVDGACPGADGGGGSGGGDGDTSDPDCDYDVGGDEVTPTNPVAPNTATIDTNGDDPEDYFVSGVWRGDIALIKRANNTVGDTDEDFEGDVSLVNDFENEIRVGGSALEVGADEFNGAAVIGEWTVCDISSRGRTVTVYLEVDGLTLEDAQILVEPVGKGVSILTGIEGEDFLVADVTLQSTVSPRFGEATFTVPEGNIGDTGFSWDGEALVYLRIEGPGEGIYGGPNGDYTSDPPVRPTIADRTFIVDSLPPQIFVEGTGRAHEYITSTDGTIASSSTTSFPSGWDPSLRNVPSSGGTFANNFRDPQAFFNAQDSVPNSTDTTTMNFTVSVMIIDPEPEPGVSGSGFLDNTELTDAGWDSRVAPADMSVTTLLYEDNVDEPGTVWLGQDSENDEFSDIIDAGGTVTFNLAEGSEPQSIRATWVFNNVPYRPDGWHVVLRINAMDRAGNEMESVRPMHLWWMKEAIGELTSESSGETRDPAFGWRIADRSESPDDPAPSQPVAQFTIYKEEPVGSGNFVYAFADTWSTWTYDRTITRATYIGDSGGFSNQTFGQALDRFANRGDLIHFYLVAADEAGNVQPPTPLDSDLTDDPGYANIIYSGEGQLNIQTDVRPRFWHNVTHLREGDSPADCIDIENTVFSDEYTPGLDIGRERDFGASTEIPLAPRDPGTFSRRVEAGFAISVSASSTGLLVGAEWELAEDGVLVATGTLEDSEIDGQMRLQLPQDLYFPDDNDDLVELRQPVSGVDPTDFLNLRSNEDECDCNSTSTYVPDRLGDDGNYEPEENCDGDETAHRRRRVTYELKVWGFALDGGTPVFDESPDTIRFVVYPPGQGGRDGQGVKEFARE